MNNQIWLQRFTLILIFTLLSFPGCAAPRHVRVAPLFADDPYWANVSPKSVDHVLISEGDLLRKYRPIARIIIDSTGRDKNISFEHMRAEAARIGADAVIKIGVSTQHEGQNVNYYTGKQQEPRNRHTLEGLAVVYE